MKTSALVALAISAANVANAIKYIDAPVGWPQAVGFNATPYEETDLYKTRRRVARNTALPPKRQDMKTRNPHIPGSKTIKIRYGPYMVPGARV
jgi:hypothetical protein